MEDDTGGLSAGRSRRSTAGNRMRELLEQEKERLEAKKGNEEDEIFKDEEGDIDFEARMEEVEDIIDSDFDQSSEDGRGDDDEDDMEGERALEEEEKAARKASRAKAGPVGMSRLPAAPKPSRPSTSTLSSSANGITAPVKRTSFAASHAGPSDGGTHRSSKRKSTMNATLTVQSRLQVEERRRQEASERAAPKRKKIRISQADRIAEALEMEEQNRADLKRFMIMEEERRERERKKGKKRMEGPFLRFRSVAEDRNASLRRKMVEFVDAPSFSEKQVPGNGAITSDPVFAAREAAQKEREAQKLRDDTLHDDSASKMNQPEMEAPLSSPIAMSLDTACHETNPAESTSAAPLSDAAPSRARTPPVEAVIAEATDNEPKEMASEAHPNSNTTKSTTDEVKEEVKEGADKPAEEGADKPIAEDEDTPVEGRGDKSVVERGDEPIGEGQEEIEGQNVEHREKLPVELEAVQADDDIPQPKESRTTETAEDEDLAQESSLVNVEEVKLLLPEYETRTYLSLHQLPPDTPWQAAYSYILGSHVDWSQYTIVPSRNRPLRPRQSVCPITGLPALYKDPRTGIAFATMEAYQMLTEVMMGRFKWSGRPSDNEGNDDDNGKEATSSTTLTPDASTYEPLKMGCWLDAVEERGACNVLNIATQKATPVVATTIARNAIAPGDEQAVVAAAKALPAGSTRSGTRRSINPTTAT
ncbi:hypothetical protein CBS101457_006827 [Exobasidium rhododendri]|nr:hypothetical protein CBS101457_006827 [Exobasidium rhododendri]